MDACARLGRSYEFAACLLPAGCRPDRAQLGFWRNGEDYLLYFRPGVAYGGPEPRLREFFGRGAVHRYPGFGALAGSLRALDGNAAALRPEEPGLLPRLRRELEGRVLGQEEAVEAVAFKLWSHVSKREPLRPLSLIFYGPTGVGKSELGKAVAPALNRCLGEERYRPVWTELNTFTQAHSVFRLTGAPPGYVGYDDAPVLEAVRDWPRTVFMFDELDKAHPEVLKVFMSILDEGRCTARRAGEDGGRELDFRRCVLLFTTNTGPDWASPPRRRLRPPALATGPPPTCPGGSSRRTRRPGWPWPAPAYCGRLRGGSAASSGSGPCPSPPGRRSPPARSPPWAGSTAWTSPRWTPPWPRPSPPGTPSPSAPACPCWRGPSPPCS